MKYAKDALSWLWTGHRLTAIRSFQKSDMSDIEAMKFIRTLSHKELLDFAILGYYSRSEYIENSKKLIF